MERTSEFEHVISQGTLRDGLSRVDYYTTLPSPDQWIAVGVVVMSERDSTSRRPRRMLVGTGRNEAVAVKDLRRRFADLCRKMREHRSAGTVRVGARSSACVKPRSQRAHRENWVADPHSMSEPHVPNP